MDDIRSLRQYTRRFAYAAFYGCFLYLAVVGSYDESYRASLRAYMHFIVEHRSAFACLAVMGVVVVLTSKK